MRVALLLVLALVACGVEEPEPVAPAPAPPCAWRQYRVRTGLYEYEQAVDDATGPLGTGSRRTWKAPPPALGEVDGAVFAERWPNVGAVVRDRASTTGCGWEATSLSSADSGSIELGP